MSEKQYYTAIDLGTTNSVIAYGNIQNNVMRPIVLELDRKNDMGSKSRNPLLPSVVFYYKNNEGKIVTDIGDYAKSRYGTRAGYVCKSVKSLMGTTDQVPLVEEIPDKTPSDVSAQILSFMVNSAKKRLFQNELSDVIITVPASFDSDQCQATIDAARKAGINVENMHDVLLYEPKAVIYTDVSKAVFYSKNEKVSGKAGQIVSALFGTEIPLSPSSQIEGFHDLLQNAYDKNVPYESVCGIYEHLQETLIDMQLSGEDVKLSNTELVNTIMEYGDVSKEKLEQLKETASDYEGCSFSVSNLVPSKVNIDTAGISIKTEIEKLSRIERRVIDGIDYYLIPVNSSSIDDILLANKHSK